MFEAGCSTVRTNNMERREIEMADLKRKVELFEKRFGGAWIGIKFYNDSDHPDSKEAKDMRFCEAIQLARRHPIVLYPADSVCPGAKRSFGWNPDPDDHIAGVLAGNQAVEAASARELLSSVPKMDVPLHAVGLETEDDPDVLISYAQPSDLMMIVRAFEVAHKKPLEQKLSSIMTICANVAVRSFLTGEICTSFGCEFSRKSGGIGRDRMAVGVPCSAIGGLLNARP